MSRNTNKRAVRRARRRQRIRKIVQGTGERPRLVVFRSLKHIEAQLVDDESSKTLLGLSTLAPDLRDGGEGSKVVKAHAAGKLLAERALQQGIETVVFDRAGYRYHGRVKAFADGAREGGLKF